MARAPVAALGAHRELRQDRRHVLPWAIGLAVVALAVAGREWATGRRRRYGPGTVTSPHAPPSATPAATGSPVAAGGFRRRHLAKPVLDQHAEPLRRELLPQRPTAHRRSGVRGHGVVTDLVAGEGVRAFLVVEDDIGTDDPSTGRRARAAEPAASGCSPRRSRASPTSVIIQEIATEIAARDGRAGQPLAGSERRLGPPLIRG